MNSQQTLVSASKRKKRKETKYKTRENNVVHYESVQVKSVERVGKLDQT